MNRVLTVECAADTVRWQATGCDCAASEVPSLCRGQVWVIAVRMTELGTARCPFAVRAWRDQNRLVQFALCEETL